MTVLIAMSEASSRPTGSVAYHFRSPSIALHAMSAYDESRRCLHERQRLLYRLTDGGRFGIVGSRVHFDVERRRWRCEEDLRPRGVRAVSDELSGRAYLLLVEDGEDHVLLLVVEVR